MTNRKNQNSIIVLATLGVYLGLVLAGATPQVLAQAAMTRQFDVKDEIEVKDDLLKDPDGCETLENKLREKQQQFSFDDTSLVKYATVIQELLLINRRIYGQPVADEIRSDFYVASEEGHYLPLVGRPRLLPYKASAELDEQLKILAGLFRESIPERSKDFSFGLSLGRYDVVLSAKYNRLSDFESQRASIAYDSALDFWRCQLTPTSSLPVLNHTQISWSTDQLLVVTRLPRAGLDPLLSPNAK